MNNNEQLITQYYNLYQELKEKGGPEEDGDLFEEVTGLEEEILSNFGLPAANKYLEILWELTNQPDLNLLHTYMTISKLKEAAERHLSAPVLTDLELLQKAREESLSAFDVLPELGLPTHDYTIFLYEVALHFVEPEEVLDEFYALKRLDCYGELAILKNKHPKSFRRTKVYKQLKPYLKFIDNYISFKPDAPFLLDWNKEDTQEGLFAEEVCQPPFEDQRLINSSTLPRRTKEPIDFHPDYEWLTDRFEMEGIIFSDDSAVSVSGKLHVSHYHKSITLGFEFDVLTKLLQLYGYKGQSILNCFNKDRQRNAEEYPVIINLKDKTGNTLFTRHHYFRVYKPLALDRDGKPQVMRDEFYIVDEVLDKATFDAEQLKHLRSFLNGSFHHLKNMYYSYLDAKMQGLSEKEARIKNALENDHLFEVSKLLHLIEKHGGQAKMR